MKTKPMSFFTILAFLGLILMVHSFGVQAGTSIQCSTSFSEKIFTIENDHISFQKEDEDGNSRAISSIQNDSVRTHKKHLGFMKTLYINGNKHRINIQNVNEFSDVNDYLSITSPKGHEMTYPLNCHSV